MAAKFYFDGDDVDDDDLDDPDFTLLPELIHDDSSGDEFENARDGAGRVKGRVHVEPAKLKRLRLEWDHVEGKLSKDAVKTWM